MTLALLFGRLIGFLTSPLGRWLGIGAAVLLALFLVHHHGYSAGEKHQKAVYAKLTAKAVQKVAKVEKAGAAITVATDVRTAQRQVEIRTVTQTLIKEIPVYVTAQADRAVDVPAGLVWLHDQAATGLPPVPAPPGFVPDAPSGVPLSAVAETVVSNYGTAFEWREAALACRAWTREQADIWAREVKAPTP